MFKRYKMEDILLDEEGEKYEIFTTISLVSVGAYYGFTSIQMSKAVSSETSKLINDYLFPRYHDQMMEVDFFENEPTESQEMETMRKRFEQFVAWLIRSRPYHEQVISSLASVDDLMKAVGSTTENLINDTPQSSNPAQDTHISNYSKTVSKGDYATPIERLAEIREKYENEMENWSKEFENLFIMYRED